MTETATPTCALRCQRCKEVYQHPKIRHGSGYRISRRKYCLDCEAKRKRESGKLGSKNSPRSKHTYPPDLPARPCYDCGELHSLRNKDTGNFRTRCGACNKRRSTEWQQAQIQREVERRLKRTERDIEQAKEAKHLMGLLVDRIEEIAPGSDLYLEADRFIRRWHP